jgi:arylsulfatase A-like enzyme
MYHAGWAWAGGTPFHHTKLIASHFGGTRNPMAISWPARIKPDKVPRPQFHHVNDIVPTIYEILGIKPPKVVDGFKQDPLDGTSMVYTFADPKAPGRKHIQYFDNNGSRQHLRPADALAHPEPRARHLGFQQGHLGTLQPQGGLLAGREPRREGAETAGGDEGAVSQGGQG